MNIQVSYNWLKEYLPGLKATPEQVAEKLSLHSFSVEKITRMDEGMDNLVVGRIEKIEKHPNADKLRVVYTEIRSPSRRRSDLPLLKIVCGGTNIKEGMLVAVALPGARVRWHGAGESIELKETEIRGVKSAGMICSASEIGLAQAFPHQEAEILDLSWTKAKPGTKLAEALDLDDAIMEIEITSNRPDAMGMIGLAREISAIFGTKLVISNSKLGYTEIQSPSRRRLDLGVSIRVDVPKLCPRYIAVMMDNIKVGQSPWWMQRRLLASGVRPINSIVDITNYVLLEYGQPCHAFDFEKLKYTEIQSPTRRRLDLPSLIVRMAKKGEKILALDGKNYDLSENILVIADEQRPVAIAGIMGGEETGVRKDTQKIIYEVANFEPIVVRKGEHELSLNSDASIRFNKGLPVDLPQYVIGRLIELTKEVSNGQVVAIVDKQAIVQKPTRLKIDPQAVQKIIGVAIPFAQMKKYLQSLGFIVSGGNKQWQVTFPYWRELEADGVEDIAEEVARMHGYHLLPSLLHSGSLVSEAPSTQFVKEQNVKQALCGAGYTELYTYSLLSREELLAGGYDPASAALELLNPLTSDLAYLRPWLGLTILSAISHNQNVKEHLNLFELSHEYIPGSGAQLPQERQKLIVAVAGKEKEEGEHFFKVKGLAEHLGAVLNLPKISFEEIAMPEKAPWVKHYHPGRVLVCKSNNDILGIVGEMHPAILSKFNIDGRVAFLEWEFSALAELIGHGRVYTSPSPYPAVKRDVSFVAPKAVKYAELITAIGKADPLIQNVELFDKYSGAGIPSDHQSLAFHISYADSSKTLTSEEADQAHNKLLKMLEQKFKARIRA